MVVYFCIYCSEILCLRAFLFYKDRCLLEKYEIEATSKALEKSKAFSIKRELCEI